MTLAQKIISIVIGVAIVSAGFVIVYQSVARGRHHTQTTCPQFTVGSSAGDMPVCASTN